MWKSIEVWIPLDIWAVIFDPTFQHTAWFNPVRVIFEEDKNAIVQVCQNGYTSALSGFSSTTLLSKS